MKIGLVIWDLTVSGGTQRQVIELARELGKYHDVDVYSYSYDPEKCFPELTRGLRIHSLSKVTPAFKPRPTDKVGRYLYDSYGLFRLFKPELQELANSIPVGLDVLNAHDTFMERVAHFYKRRSPGTRTVWMSNDSPAIVLAVDHDNLHPRKMTPSRLVQKWLYSITVRYENAFVRDMDSIVVLDGRNKRQIEELMHRPAIIVRSGLAIDKFTPAAKPKHAAFQILGTGIFFRHRRFEDLIGAVGVLVKRGRKVHLNIIGRASFDPSYGDELANLAKKLELGEAISFLGTVSEQELLRQYREANVFVFPNHLQTWGLAVFEAMASGTPVVVSRTSGAHEVLTDGENALLVDPKQPEQIADRIEQLMDSEQLQRDLAKNGRAFVEKNITWEKYARNMERVFQGEAPKGNA
jgi:glycosyltransferase involved in cell wall biosynthesis